MDMPEPGTYRHYKGGLYRLHAVAYLEADHSRVAVYEALYEIPELGGQAWFVRPLGEFMERFVPLHG